MITFCSSTPVQIIISIRSAAASPKIDLQVTPVKFSHSLG